MGLGAWFTRQSHRPWAGCWGLGLSVVLLWTQASLANPAPATRVVSLGGSVTEIVYALGVGDALVAVDESSVYPAATAQLPTVGYYRNTPIEGLVALRPDLVLASSQAGPPEVLERIARLGVPVVTVPDVPTIAALRTRIEVVAEVMGVPERGRDLADAVTRGVNDIAATSGTKRSAVFLMYRNGWWLAAGSETSAAATMALAGLSSAVPHQGGYVAVSTESLAALAPEVIVTTTLSVAAAGGVEAFARLPGVRLTPAGRASRLIVLDDLLVLGFGPRLPEAVAQLREGQCDDAR